MNGLGEAEVLPCFAFGIGTSLAGGYSGGPPLANSGALQTSSLPMREFSNVLLVSNLYAELVTPDAPFTLFGVYL